MEQHINDAVKLYSGDRPIGLFVDRLGNNIEAMNELFAQIQDLFTSAGVQNFEKLPDDLEACGKFATLFNTFNQHLEAARIQGMTWEESVYTFAEQGESEAHEIQCDIDEQTYSSLVLRYKELADQSEAVGGGSGDIPFDLDGHITEIDTVKIDADYMNSRFDKYLKELNQPGDSANIEATLNELHKTFALLTQTEQKYAKLFLHDLQRGEAPLIEGHSFRYYINVYQNKAENDHINSIVDALGLDKSLLLNLLADNVTESNLNTFGRFDALKETVNKEKAKAYFEKLDGVTIPPFKLNIRIDKYLRGVVLFM